MALTNIGGFFNSYSFDQSTGELTLSSADGLNSAVVKICNSTSFNNITDRKPDIYTGLVLSPENGSFAILENGKEIYYRTNDKWKLIFREDNKRRFRIPFFDNSISYEKDKIVGYNGKKYKSNKDETTIGLQPTTVTYDYSFSQKRLKPLHGLSNIIAIAYCDSNLVITTTDNIYMYNNTDNGVSVFDGSTKGDTKKVCSYGSALIRIESDNSVTVSKGGYDVYRYSFNNEPSSICTNNGKCYVAVPGDNKIYMFMPYTDDIVEIYSGNIPNNSIISATNSYVFVFDNENHSMNRINIDTLEINTYNTSDELIDVSITNDSLVYGLFNNGKLYESESVNNEWSEVTIDDMFKLVNCPSPYVLFDSFENIVEKSRYRYSESYCISDYFCFVDNRFIVFGDKSRKKIFKTDISDGVFLPKYTGEQLEVGHNLGGLAFFDNNLLVANWQTISVVDPDTMEILRTIDMQNKIEDARIISMSSKGDTLYIFTTNGKIYKFDDIDSPVSGVVALEMYNEDSRICVIDADTVYVSNAVGSDTAIWEESLFDGTVLGKTQLDRGLNVDMSMMFGQLYVMDLGGARMLTKYRKTTIRKEA